METLSEALTKLCERKNYKDLYDFLKKYDVKANSYIGQMARRVRIPADDRLLRWCDQLEATDEERAKIMKLAAIDRVYAAAKRNAVLRVGLNLILEELDLLRAQVGKAKVELAKLKEQIIKLTTGGDG